VVAFTFLTLEALTFASKVCLNGNVASRRELDRALEIATGTPGVSAVRAEINVNRR
jgi:osmotically-inducible protein OsmY